jgi:hypothetical protein
MKRFIGTVGSLLPFVSRAHPGHGSTAGSSVAHYLSEPLHLMGGVIVLVLLLYVVQKTYKTIQSDQDNH